MIYIDDVIIVVLKHASVISILLDGVIEATALSFRINSPEVIMTGAC